RDEVDGLEVVAGVGTAPAEVVGDAGLADEGGVDAGAGWKGSGGFELFGNLSVIAQAFVHFLGDVLSGQAGHLAEVTIHFEHETGDLGSVAGGVGGIGDEM